MLLIRGMPCLLYDSLPPFGVEPLPIFLVTSPRFAKGQVTASPPTPPARPQFSSTSIRRTMRGGRSEQHPIRHDHRRAPAEIARGLAGWPPAPPALPPACSPAHSLQRLFSSGGRCSAISPIPERAPAPHRACAAHLRDRRQ